MKHFIIYLLAGLMIFGIIKAMALPVSDTGESSQERGAYTAAMAVDSGGNASDIQPVQVNIGVIMCGEETMDSIRFRDAIQQFSAEESLCTLHICEAVEALNSQLQLLERLISDGSSVVFVELQNADDAQSFIDKAAGRAKLVFLDNEPSSEVLSGGGCYYLGFADTDSLRIVAQNIGDAWSRNPGLLDYFEDDSLAVAYLSDQDFDENGNAESFETSLRVRGVDSTLAKASVTSYFDFDLKKEIDRIWVAKAELLICTSSSDARKALDYLNDPTEFAFNRIKLVVLSADEETEQMVESGEILLAVGSDGKQLGETAVKLAGMLTAGQEPSEDALNVTIRSNCIYVPSHVIRSGQLDSLPEVAAQEEEE